MLTVQSAQGSGGNVIKQGDPKTASPTSEAAAKLALKILKTNENPRCKMKGSYPRVFNGIIPHVSCLHLVIGFLRGVEIKQKIKFSPFDSPDGVRVRSGLREGVWAKEWFYFVANKSPECYLVEVNSFGSWLVGQSQQLFDSSCDTSNGVLTKKFFVRLFAVETLGEDHALGIVLQYKKQNDRKYFVLDCFETNLSNQKYCTYVDDLENFIKVDFFKNFTLSGKDYFPKKNGAMLIYAVPNDYLTEKEPEKIYRSYVGREPLINIGVNDYDQLPRKLTGHIMYKNFGDYSFYRWAFSKMPDWQTDLDPDSDVGYCAWMDSFSSYGRLNRYEIFIDIGKWLNLETEKLRHNNLDSHNNRNSTQQS